MVIYIAHSDGTVKRWDLQKGQPPVDVGKHEHACKDVCSFAVGNQLMLASGGFDCVVKFYMVNQGNVQQCGESYVGKPVHYMSAKFPVLVTAHSEKVLHVWNLQNIPNAYAPACVVESPLKYQTALSAASQMARASL